MIGSRRKHRRHDGEHDGQGRAQLGIDGAGITDHLALNVFLHLVVFSELRVVLEPRYWLCTRDRGRSHIGDLPCPYEIRNADANQSLPSACRIDPTRDTDQNSCLAPCYSPLVIALVTAAATLSTSYPGATRCNAPCPTHNHRRHKAGTRY